MNISMLYVTFSLKYNKSERECIVMAKTEAQLNREKQRLATARDGIKPLQTQADEERKSAKTNFETNVQYWKGKAFDKFKEERDTLNTNYNNWIRKGSANDGSINGAMDQINNRISAIGNLIDQLGSWWDSLFN